jgi:catechol 2,3-dioxygenase-like lactoylglutathione lyase family enzyme
MPYRISRLGTVEIRSLDLDRDLDYYLNVLGLQLTAREGKTAYLKGWDERHAYSVVLTEADRAGMVRLAFRTVDPEDLDYYENRLREFSVKYDVILRITAEAAPFALPCRQATSSSSTTRWNTLATFCPPSTQRRGRRALRESRHRAWITRL